MKPLIDYDMLIYEVGFGIEYKDEEGNLVIKPFDSAVELLEQKIKEIVEETWADEEPTLFLTGDERIRSKLNRRLTKEGKPLLEDKPNFRISLANTKEYKGNRQSRKPFHYDNLRTWALSQYDTQIAWGIEADDLLSITHRLDPENTIICSRDKDLRITPGNHFGLACGKQPQFGPQEIDQLGYLELTSKGIKGGGLKMFYSQLLTGDTVDNIPGVPRKGPSFAFKLLADLPTEEELFDAVTAVYEEYKGEDWRDYFKEQAALLWMIQELDDEGNPIHYVMPDER